jgi:drug/metabolite transporter (DMT)-like permease
VKDKHVVIMFALAAAVLYGSADFLGGAATRRSRALSVASVSVPAGALVMLAPALVAGGAAPTAGLGWALAAGAVGAVGLIVFYAGLASGPMSVVAPVSALVSTVIPVGVAVASGERLGGPVYAGAVLCLVAIVLVSVERGRPAAPPATGQRAGHRQPATGQRAGHRQPAGPAWQAVTAGRARRLGHHPALRGVVYGIACGAMFGIFYVFLRNAGSSGVFWPVCVARLANTAVVFTACMLAGVRLVGREASARVLAASAASGVLDAAANLCYVLATRAGLFGIAAVLTSLYPGITVLLARVVLGERMHPVQRAGLLLAAFGVALVTL